MTRQDPFKESAAKVIRDRGCLWQTAYGLPHTETCGKRLRKGRVFCAEHERDNEELYPHLPRKRAPV